MTNKILVVEDDPATADYIVKGLCEAGYTVDRAADGRDGLFHATDSAYSVIVLDRMLPGMDGVAVLSAMRAAGVETPVIILSAMGSLDERVKGLKAGSDDYLVKPFGFAELHARIEALQRRGKGVGEGVPTSLSCGSLVMDLLSHRVARAGQKIDLQPREFRLLEYLLRHKDQVVTRTMLLEGVWDYHFDPGTNVIDVHVSRLRKKIDSGPETPLLHTIRGAGYMLSETP